MRLTIQSTPATGLMNGSPCRIWSGTSDRGLAVRVYVLAIGVPHDADPAEAFAFETELHALPQAEPPRHRPRPFRRRLRPLSLLRRPERRFV